jgi:hypothetical protein
MRPGRWLQLGLAGTLAVLPVACATADLADDDGVTLPDRSEAGDVAAPVIDSAVPDVAQPVVDASVPVDSAVPKTPRAFVTSSTQNANFGGLAGGDLICTNLAIAAGLVGKWAAWLSIQNGPHAVNRITGAGPWKLVTGEVVAATKAQLVSGSLAHAIDHDEKGVAVVGGRAWTGTNASGVYETNDCDKWTNGSNGRVGDGTSITATWTSVGVDSCGQARRLYCFEL